MNDVEGDLTIFPTGKCPKCQALISHADLDGITIGNKLGGPLWQGVSAICPSCKTVLGVAIDPISLKTDIVKEVLQGLGLKSKKR